VMQVLKRVESSRAALSGARAEYWPSVGFSASTSKSRRYSPDSSSESSSARFDASWEIDVFGKVRRSVEAARAELEAAEFTAEDAMVSLFAEIAAEYVNLRLQDEVCAITEANIGITEEFAKIAKSKYDAGMAPELDWLSAQSQLDTTRAALETAQAAKSSCRRRIELLASVAPHAFDALLDATAPSLPAAPQNPVAVPSDLLRRRPDVRRAERAYAAALARIGVAKASYYPSVSIGAGFSLSTDSFASWGDAVRSVNFGPSLGWSLLDFGRRGARLSQARIAAEEAALAYRSAVLSAFHEVEGCAIAIDREAARETFFQNALENQEKAADLATRMYKDDLGEYRDVLSAQQSLLSQRRSLAELRANRVLAGISLCKAIGVR